VIAVFSWPDVATDYWLARCFWYLSLLLAIAAVILASQHSSLIASLPETWALNEDGVKILAEIILDNPIVETNKGDEEEGEVAAYTCARTWKSWNIEFVWQSPHMLMAWSWVFFMGGLTLHICTPFFRQDYSNDAWIVFLTALTFVRTLLTLDLDCRRVHGRCFHRHAHLCLDFVLGLWNEQ